MFLVTVLNDKEVMCPWRSATEVILYWDRFHCKVIFTVSLEDLFSYLGHNAVLVESKSYVFCFENGEEM